MANIINSTDIKAQITSSSISAGLSVGDNISSKIDTSNIIHGKVESPKNMSIVLNSAPYINCSVVTSHSISGSLLIPNNIVDSDLPVYDGSYQWTPSQTTQTVQVKNKITIENIVINPIPSNYGLITWNGAVMTVS